MVILLYFETYSIRFDSDDIADNSLNIDIH